MTFSFERRYEIAFVSSFAKKLRDDLDLLTARQEVIERHASDASHFRVVDEAHELVQKTLREVGVLEGNDLATLTNEM